MLCFQCAVRKARGRQAERCDCLVVVPEHIRIRNIMDDYRRELLLLPAEEIITNPGDTISVCDQRMPKPNKKSKQYKEKLAKRRDEFSLQVAEMKKKRMLNKISIEYKKAKEQKRALLMASPHREIGISASKYQAGRP